MFFYFVKIVELVVKDAKTGSGKHRLSVGSRKIQLGCFNEVCLNEVMLSCQYFFSLIHSIHNLPFEYRVAKGIEN